MRLELNNVDTIEIDYELQMYKSDIYTTPESRIYNSRESIYGISQSTTQSFLGFETQQFGEGTNLYSFPNIMNKSRSSMQGN